MRDSNLFKLKATRQIVLFLLISFVATIDLASQLEAVGVAASSSGSPQTNNNDNNKRYAAWSKRVGYLLEEADRLISAESSSSDKSESSNSVKQQQHDHSSWLARVSKNPNYAKLVQYFLRQRNGQSNRATGSNKQHNFNDATRFDQREEGQGRQQLATMGDEIYEPSGNGQSSTHINVVYGQEARYPHEMEEKARNAASRTLDKLRKIKAEQQEMTTGDDIQLQQQNAMSNDDDDDNSLESNKIPLIGGDGEPWVSSSEAAVASVVRPTVAELMRKNVVYGTERLRPSQMGSLSNSIYQQVAATGQPINALRQLSGEFSSANHMGAATSTSTTTTTTSGVRGSESFGRVLNNPSVWISNREQQPPMKDANSDSMLFKLRSHHREAERMANGQQQQDSELDELASQQAGGIRVNVAPSETGSGSASGSTGSGMGEPLAGQEENNNSNNEFEGFFHSGPLNQIEVRQIRSQEEERRASGNSKPRQ